jgi:hypothetical protein
MYVCAWMYVCVYVYIHIHTYIHTLHTNITYIHIYIHTSGTPGAISFKLATDMSIYIHKNIILYIIYIKIDVCAFV